MAETTASDQTQAALDALRGILDAVEAVALAMFDVPPEADKP
jgi:hypothetical protein